MTEQNQQPLEETQQVADAVEDDVAVDAFITGGGPDAENPVFLQPGEEPGEEQPGDEQSGDEQPGADRSGGGRSSEERPSKEPTVRTGADQPWDPVDLAVAEGRDPTPENIERARKELERDGPAAIERTVP